MLQNTATLSFGNITPDEFATLFKVANETVAVDVPYRRSSLRSETNHLKGPL